MHQGQILNFQNRFIWDCDEIWRRNERSKAKEKRYRVVSPSFINSALKNEIWKIPLQIFVFWML